jgi:putative lipoic acid-binding regulatory protein
MIDLNDHKLELEYPCEWCYKIVINAQENGDKIAKDVLDTRPHTVKSSKQSSGGKFKSYRVDLIVNNDEDRKELHRLFGAHEHVRMIV